MNKIAVIGAGAWGTALAIQAVRAGSVVELVARNVASAKAIAAARSSKRLAGITIPEEIGVSADLHGRADLWVWAVPTQQLRSSLNHFQTKAGVLLVCAKGVEAGTNLLPLEIVAQVLGDRPAAVLSGPNFAHEVAKGLPTAAVVGAKDVGLRDFVRDRFATAGFRLYGNDDPVGVQLGGAAKNVIAIGAGAVIGAGLGENARAALVTRGLSEMRRLIIAQGGHADTAMGLSGLGDLMLTCAGPSSRNFRLGLALGAGKLPPIIEGEVKGTVEGLATATALVRRAESIELPICRAVSELLEGRITLEEAVENLLSRPQRDE